jgi:hypothetical protein
MSNHNKLPMQRVALLLTRTSHARRIGRVEFLAGKPACIMQNGSSTLKSAVGHKNRVEPQADLKLINRGE